MLDLSKRRHSSGFTCDSSRPIKMLPFPLWVPLYVLAQQKISLDLVLRRRKREATQVVLLNGKENQVILE